jgi:RNA polymerase sigma factor (TIGR02999 family)
MEANPGPPDVTALLEAWNAGNQGALERLIPVVYGELRRIAVSCLKNERPNHTLQATALVHEVYGRLVGRRQISFNSRAHFLGVCAKVMRHILTDYARHHGNQGHGGGVTPDPLEEALVLVQDRPKEFIALDEALDRLAQVDARKSKVVERRFFGGMTNEEIAEELEISVNTVIRDWDFARAWLERELASKK